MTDDCGSKSITISDHSRIYLDIYLDNENFISKRLKFDMSLLKDEEFKSKMQVWRLY